MLLRCYLYVELLLFFLCESGKKWIIKDNYGQMCSQEVSYALYFKSIVQVCYYEILLQFAKVTSI
jgi:hypothetical protein